MSKAEDAKKQKERDKEDKTLDFDTWFNQKLDSHLKARSKTHKQFKHKVHNYTTGLIILDHFINPKNPGLLGGNIVQFAGHGGAGKTTTALNIAKYHVQQGFKVVYLDPEDGLEDTLLEGFGLSKYSNPLFRYIPARLKAEQYFDIMKESILKLQGEADPVLFIVDSITYLRPEVETFDKVRVGDNIPFFNNFIRAIRPYVGNTNSLVILLNGVYRDNDSMYGDYKISGGETLKRACDLITLHYKRANPAGAGADEEHTKVVNKNFSTTYRQKLGIKIVKNKWAHSDTKLSALDYFFTTDQRFGTFGLDNTQSMLAFLKQMGILRTQGAPGCYAMGDKQMTWKRWELETNTNEETRLFVFKQTLAALQDLFVNPIDGD